MNREEEILDKVDWSGDYPSWPQQAKDNILSAMRELARERAIGFAEWKDRVFKISYPSNGKVYILKEYESVNEFPGLKYGEHYSIPELYIFFAENVRPSKYQFPDEGSIKKDAEEIRRLAISTGYITDNMSTIGILALKIIRTVEIYEQ